MRMIRIKYNANLRIDANDTNIRMRIALQIRTCEYVISIIRMHSHSLASRYFFSFFFLVLSLMISLPW